MHGQLWAGLPARRPVTAALLGLYAAAALHQLTLTPALARLKLAYVAAAAAAGGWMVLLAPPAMLWALPHVPARAWRSRQARGIESRSSRPSSA